MNIKKRIALGLCLVLCFGLISGCNNTTEEATTTEAVSQAPECNEHIDENADSYCDLCGYSISLNACNQHTDTDLNGYCDNCSGPIVLTCFEHGDGNFDGYCDLCYAFLGNTCPNHMDLDEDGICNTCNEVM